MSFIQNYIWVEDNKRCSKAAMSSIDTVLKKIFKKITGFRQKTCTFPFASFQTVPEAFGFFLLQVVLQSKEQNQLFFSN